MVFKDKYSATACLTKSVELKETANLTIPFEFGLELRKISQKIFLLRTGIEFVLEDTIVWKISKRKLSSKFS